MQAPAALPVGSAAQMRTVDAGSRTASVTLRSFAARRPVALARRAIARDDRRRADRRRPAIGDRSRRRSVGGSGRSRPDEGEIDRFDPRLDRVGAVERMGDRGVDRNDDRRSRGVAIVDRHVPQGSQAMGGGQKNARAQHQGRAEAGLVAAADQHHRHPVGKAAVGLGADERARRCRRRAERRGERQQMKRAGQGRDHGARFMRQNAGRINGFARKSPLFRPLSRASSV